MLIDMPQVSVCIPVRNGAKFIEQAVSSILEQSYQDFEVVIIDNCSTDNTADLVRELGTRTSKIKLYKNDQNIGLIENFNACLNRSTGKYIKFLCADDVLMPDCLELMVSALKKHESASLVTAGRLLINENGKVLATKLLSKEDKIFNGKNIINLCLFGANYIGEPSATMFRRGVLDEGFDAKFPHLVDLEMWFRLLELGDLVSISKPLCAIRRHDLQMTKQNIKSANLVEDNVNLYDIYKLKPYIKFNLMAVLVRKLRMAYRVWNSRKYIPTERKRQILKLQSSYFCYYLLIPIVNILIVLIHKIHYQYISIRNSN